MVSDTCSNKDVLLPAHRTTLKTAGAEKDQHLKRLFVKDS